MSGLQADARSMIEHARLQSQNHAFHYNEPLPVESCTQAICDLALRFGEGADGEERVMSRPFGVALLIAGYDDEGPSLYAPPTQCAPRLALTLNQVLCGAVRHFLSVRRQGNRIRIRRRASRVAERIPQVHHSARGRSARAQDAEAGDGGEVGLEERAVGERDQRQGVPDLHRRGDGGGC